MTGIGPAGTGIGAGAAAGFPDAEYKEAGAKLVTAVDLKKAEALVA